MGYITPMVSPKEITARFYEVLLKEKEKYGRGFNKFLCLETGLSSGFVSQIVSGKQSPTPETQEKILQALSVDYQALLRPNNQSNNVVRFESSIEKEHFNIIKSFEDPETALSFNSFLVKLEKLDVKKYEEVFGEVRGHVRDLERKKKEEERKASGQTQRKASSDDL